MYDHAQCCHFRCMAKNCKLTKIPKFLFDYIMWIRNVFKLSKQFFLFSTSNPTSTTSLHLCSVNIKLIKSITCTLIFSIHWDLLNFLGIWQVVSCQKNCCKISFEVWEKYVVSHESYTVYIIHKVIKLH